MNHLPRLSAVLFDLDGTLLDTAPDMVAALNALRAEEDAPALPYEASRAQVSNGALGMLRFAFGDLPEERRGRLHQRYLALYAARLTTGTRLFPGMDAVIGWLEAARVPWGVVTNKPAHLTDPLLATLGLRKRCACVVSGDTTAERKPHPLPLLHGLGMIPAEPGRAVYVGDAARDIAAGRAAGMRTVAALYGYIPPEEVPERWGADHHVAAPADLPALLTRLNVETDSPCP
ncbi:MAG: phosphoglycolate phosphatase [Gammaproteobacteria bacterium]|nr:phosphoglycolate phosphatase [Gammaproteobacteria bacterium]